MAKEKIYERKCPIDCRIWTVVHYMSRLFDFQLRLHPGRKTDRRPCLGRGERRVFGTEPDLKVNKNKT